MAKIVLTDAKMKMLQSVWSDINALGDVKVVDNDDEDTLVKEAPDTELFITCYASITRGIIEAGKNLKAILKWGVGVDSIDIAAANDHRLPVCHCPHYGSGTIADRAFATMIALARKLVPIINTTREKGWLWPDTSRQWAGTDLEGKTVGLVGFGRIAKKMARRCTGFDMKIKAYDPRITTLPAEWQHVELTTLEEVLGSADFVSVHAVLNRENKGLIGARELALMKPTAFIINTARGALIREQALIDTLREKRIAGAAIDVFDPEPIDTSHPYNELDNILITPHFAYYTVEADDRLDRECYYSAKRIIENGTLVNVKNGDALAALGEPVRWLPYGELPYKLD
jgi:D-3-phosphoglycerate dehydrogenase / 2-oxoglutarate reductase